MLIFALSRSKPVQWVTEILQHVINSKGFEGVDINTLPKMADRFSKEGVNIGSDDSPFFLVKRYENVIFISRISYDPLFGFSGAPTMILRHYMEEQNVTGFRVET
jgi:hypothetical protein